MVLVTLVCLRLHLLNTRPATAFPAAEIIWEMETRSGSGVSAVIQRRPEKAHRLPGDLPRGRDRRTMGAALGYARRVSRPRRPLGARPATRSLRRGRPSVIERSAMPDSPERLHAQIQASIPAELHDIRRAAERRAPEAG